MRDTTVGSVLVVVWGGLGRPYASMPISWAGEAQEQFSLVGAVGPGHSVRTGWAAGTGSSVQSLA